MRTDVATAGGVPSILLFDGDGERAGGSTVDDEEDEEEGTDGTESSNAPNYKIIGSMMGKNPDHNTDLSESMRQSYVDVTGGNPSSRTEQHYLTTG